MPNNFCYAAYSYLDEWMATDRNFHKILNSNLPGSVSDEKGADCLLEIAKKYGVIRTLRKIEEPGRLLVAYKMLTQINTLAEADVVDKIKNFAVALGEVYGDGQTVLSAASKFLWMKFRSPVIIYDAKAKDWLKKKCKADLDDYSHYCDCWRAKYNEYGQEIESACKDLIGVKRFALACEESDERLSEWTSSQWFRERVFDHYMLNAETFERLTRDH